MLSSAGSTQVQEPNVAKSLMGGLTATVVVTALMYLSPATGNQLWNIPRMLIEAMPFDHPVTPVGSGPAWGLMVYLIFNVLVLPACYAYWIYNFMPGPDSVRGLMFGGLVWLLLQIVVVPFSGGRGLFHRPLVDVEVFSPLILWLLYGFVLGFTAGPQAEWRQREGHV